MGCPGRGKCWFLELQELEERALSQGTLKGLGILLALPAHGHSTYLAFSLPPTPEHHCTLSCHPVLSLSLASSTPTRRMCA